ncbi:MAG: ATP phosphoribosyltransferase regulatory subunit [Gammaproteobacteria bacterium]|nr:ATP phosphoribosyltransferase regulatory subunit [Gammaproteobacteria bacterium]
MIPDRWLLPEGVDEVLPPEARRLEGLRRRLIDLFSGWGYELVITPFIEYLDSLLIGTGHDLDLATFKLTDQLTGRMMGVRADMTPQVARIDAQALGREEPVRLCYIGTVLHALPDGFTRTRAPVQVGAELYGHAGVESDCEVVCLMLETLALAGVRDVHLDLGHVGVFRGLARKAKLDEADELRLHGALQRKARAEVEEIVAALRPAPALGGMLESLVDLNGDAEVVERARGLLGGAGREVAAAIDRLERLAREVRARVPDVPVHFDLAELRGYRYHTGVVFAALVPGHGREIARGGRYDEVGAVFGRRRPATGFSTDLKSLAALGVAGAGGGTQAETHAAILAPWSDDAELQAEVRALRAKGERVIYELPAAGGGATARAGPRLRKRGDRWVLEPR